MNCPSEWVTCGYCKGAGNDYTTGVHCEPCGGNGGWFERAPASAPKLFGIPGKSGGDWIRGKCQLASFVTPACALDDPHCPTCQVAAEYDRLERAWNATQEEEVRLRRIASQLITEAKMATNALACVAKAKYQHAEVTRLHIAIDLLTSELARGRAADEFPPGTS